MSKKSTPLYHENRRAYVATGSEQMTYEMLGLLARAEEDLPGAPSEMLMSYSRLLYAERAASAKKTIP